MILHQAYSKLPPSVRERLKGLLRSNGHSSSIMDPLTARKDALGKKRLDRSLRHLIETLGEDGARMIAGRTCVEFGAGYVATDAISMWLLGADSVTAVDYNSIANSRAMHLALAKADLTEVHSLLESVKPESDWENRVKVIEQVGQSAAGKFPFGRIPFKYLAPLDVTVEPSRLPEFDFLWSTSVLEHIRPSQIIAVLESLHGRAASDSIEVHHVDLRDHRDFDGAPYGFLDPSVTFDPEQFADTRGNAMTLERWELLLSENSELGLEIVGFISGQPNMVPKDPFTSKPVIDRAADYLTIATTNFLR